MTAKLNDVFSLKILDRTRCTDISEFILVDAPIVHFTQKRFRAPNKMRLLG